MSSKLVAIHLSLFSWVRDQLDEDIELLKTEFISQRVQNLLGNIEWRRDIASLMYNVDTTHAYQALLSQDIIRLLPKDSESKLKELSKIKGFHSVLVDVIQTSTEEWAREDAILISNVIDNISLLDFGKHELNVIFSKISNTIPYLATRKKDQALDTFTGLIKLGNFSSNSDKAIATILDVMSWASINIKTINGDTNRAAKEWADFYLLMISDYDESLKSKISRTLILPSDPDFIVSLASSNPDLGTYNPSNLLIETEQIERAITKDYDKNATFTALKTLKNLFSSRFLTAIQRQCVDKLTRAESEPSIFLEQISQIFYLTYTSEENETSELFKTDTLGIILKHLHTYHKAYKKHLISLTWIVLNEFGHEKYDAYCQKLSVTNIPYRNSITQHFTFMMDSEKYSEEEIDQLVHMTKDKQFMNRWKQYAKISHEVNDIHLTVIKRLIPEYH
ncbi:MAG: hypothetical protein R3271_13900 [Methylophaga sp.]|uniref:hypothetical protein n=1 Tax=Methylophaga sp. TaxID=2024840 RepID=UPI00299D409C|nr:hypothetical protein [Methylophaga sp.]MDX1751401.1 hypothetical protein [Methylophaga sp.]